LGSARPASPCPRVLPACSGRRLVGRVGWPAGCFCAALSAPPSVRLLPPLRWCGRAATAPVLPCCRARLWLAPCPARAGPGDRSLLRPGHRCLGPGSGVCLACTSPCVAGCSTRVFLSRWPAALARWAASAGGLSRHACRAPAVSACGWPPVSLQRLSRLACALGAAAGCPMPSAALVLLGHAPTDFGCRGGPGCLSRCVFPAVVAVLFGPPLCTLVRPWPGRSSAFPHPRCASLLAPHRAVALRAAACSASSRCPRRFCPPPPAPDTQYSPRAAAACAPAIFLPCSPRVAPGDGSRPATGLARCLSGRLPALPRSSPGTAAGGPAGRRAWRSLPAAFAPRLRSLASGRSHCRCDARCPLPFPAIPLGLGPAARAPSCPPLAAGVSPPARSPVQLVGFPQPLVRQPCCASVCPPWGLRLPVRRPRCPPSGPASHRSPAAAATRLPSHGCSPFPGSSTAAAGSRSRRPRGALRLLDSSAGP